ncbi:MAG: hypothetical protein IPO93_04900 [Actinobacteria bacterium]|nr:hypothetical protein [Actinomycetota bacterium]
MNLHSLALPLAYVGALLSVAMVLPQLTRTIRHPHLPGVSALSWALTAVGCLGWLLYGLRISSVPQIPGNVLLISGAVAVVILVPSVVSRSRRALGLAAAAGLLLLVNTVVPAQTVGYVAFAISMVSAWPQLFESYGNWRTGGESGLSLTTWSVKIASTSSWLAYGILAADLPVLVACSVGLVTTLAIIGMETSARYSVARDAEAVLERV